VFAGAAREAVFSNPDVVRRVNAEFVPVALKAGLVNGADGDDAESRLYRAIGRSKPAEQGICVADSTGRLPDFVDDVAAPVVEEHADPRACPARRRIRSGTLVARVVGRALDAKGQPVADTVGQESYAEDRFEVPLDAQAMLARAVSGARTARVRVPDELARLFASHAYLGHLDVRPTASPAPDSVGEVARCDLFVSSVDGGLRLEGESVMVTEQGARPVDGASFRHEIKLTWEGFIAMSENRIARLLLAARGSEKLLWRNGAFPGWPASEGQVSHLMAGRPIDLACEVRYGIVGEPVPESEAVAAGTPLRSADVGEAAKSYAIQRKVGALHAGVRRWQSEGRDPAPVGRIMQEFEPMIRAGRLEEAEAILDRALTVLGPP
jgi:hypothetical protein